MVQRGVVRSFRRERTHRLFTERSIVVVEESTTGGAVLVVSELVHHACVESMARPLKEEGIELSGEFVQEGYSQLSPNGALNMLTTWRVIFCKEGVTSKA